MTTTPTFSIIATCYNQARYVEACLDSIQAQTNSDWELIITDDASTDDSQRVITDWSDRHDISPTLLFSEQNRGLTRTLNAALEACSGQFVVHLGCDDMADPCRIEAHAGVVSDLDDDVAVIYSDGRTVDEGGSAISSSWMAENHHLPGADGAVFDQLLRGNFVLGCSATYRRSAVADIGGWDPKLPFEDWDLLLRLADRYRFLFIDGIVSSYRIHEASMMRSQYPVLVEARLRLLGKWAGHDRANDEYLLPMLRERAWRLYRADPDLGRDAVLIHFADTTTVGGRLRWSVARWPLAERAYDTAARAWQALRGMRR